MTIQIVSYLSGAGHSSEGLIPKAFEHQYSQFDDGQLLNDYIKLYSKDLRLLIFETDYSDADIRQLRNIKKMNPRIEIILLSLVSDSDRFLEFAKLGVVAIHDPCIHPAIIHLDIDTVMTETDEGSKNAADVLSSDFECSVHSQWNLGDCDSHLLSDPEFLDVVHSDLITKESASKRVLIIEDDYDLNKQLSQWLNAKGFCCASALNGNDALNQLKETPNIDLVVLDIGLPNITGDLLIESIKALSPRSKIIVLSAYKDNELITACLKVGAHDYLTKPFSPEELLSVLKKQSLFAALEQLNKSQWLSCLSMANETLVSTT